MYVYSFQTPALDDDGDEDDDGSRLYGSKVKASMKLLHSGQIDMATMEAAEAGEHGFSDSRELRSKCSKKTFSIFQGFLGSRQFFQTHDKFSDYLSIRICTDNIFLGALYPPPRPPPLHQFATPY